jgi:glycosidase
MDVRSVFRRWKPNCESCPQLGNHDHGRVASQLGDDLLDCVNMILLMLPGTAVTYSGEEIGIENTPVPWDPARSGHSSEANAGLSRVPQDSAPQDSETLFKI